MPNRFADVMARRTTTELAAIVTRPDDWEADAIAAARAEMAKREVTIEDAVADAADSVVSPDYRDREWVRWAVLVMSFILFAFIPISLVHHQFPDAVVELLLGGSGILGFRFITESRRDRTLFLDWLRVHASEITRGEAAYDGIPVGLGTKVRAFDASISLLVFTTRFSSRWVLDGDAAAEVIRSRFTLVTLVFGWWGIPFGPFFTIGAALTNLRGGRVATVADVLGVSA